jgi:hypothetical protein
MPPGSRIPVRNSVLSTSYLDLSIRSLCACHHLIGALLEGLVLLLSMALQINTSKHGEIPRP